jgi:hypothetical protein
MTTQLPKISLHQLYEEDFYQWLEITANLLRERKLDQLDLENLIEEIESMGRSEKRELRNRLITLLEHFLKLAYWDTERELNERGWKNTVIEQRKQIELLLRDSLSLKPFLDDIFSDCYQDARDVVSRKTNLPSATFPEQSPFSVEKTIDPDYFPEEIKTNNEN